MHPLLNPAIVNLVQLKANEELQAGLHQPVTKGQAEACINALIWMQEKLQEKQK